MAARPFAPDGRLPAGESSGANKDSLGATKKSKKQAAE